MKKTAVILLALTVLCLMAPLAFAEEGAAAATATKGTSNILYYALAALGCGLGIGLAALGTGIGQGIGLGGACEGVARNPGASGKITTTLIIGLAMIESLAIYALVVVLILIFVNPFGKLLQ
ncbi:MAG: ATP synthase F0 subunit C [Nitrospirae bacterium]|jgi:F-type H+-transporting ATPase subunit c|nr:ATP synthase F0 subunit C [Nitrospirota bacterium]